MYIALLDDCATEDIQDAMNYYEEKQVGLGNKFKAAVDNEISALEINPFYQIRYKTVRCKLVKRFPYLIHFTVNEVKKQVIIFAVINTSKDPETNWVI